MKFLLLLLLNIMICYGYCFPITYDQYFPYVVFNLNAVVNDNNFFYDDEIIVNMHGVINIKNIDKIFNFTIHEDGCSIYRKDKQVFILKDTEFGVNIFISKDYNITEKKTIFLF
jgi:hypothetical protein